MQNGNGRHPGHDCRGANILVAGAGGFIGGALVAALREAGARRIRAVDWKPLEEWYQRFDDVENLRLDLRELDACRTAARGMSEIYNLACDMGGMGFIEAHKAECMLNVLISTHLLVAARDAGSQRLFYSSSACVYAAEKQKDSEVQPLREPDAYPAEPEDGYGWEKLFSERLYLAFNRNHGMQNRVARYHNIFGPEGTWEGGKEKAPAAICRKVAETKNGGTIEMWGDGLQTRSFLYIDECVEGSFRLARSAHEGPFNIGSEEMVTINQLASMVMDIAGKKLEIEHIPGPLGVRGRNSDNRLIKSTLGWAPSQPLMAGLEKTYAWIEAQVARKRGANVKR